jgi:hypothetical protein
MTVEETKEKMKGPSEGRYITESKEIVYTDKTQMFMGRSRKMGKTLSRDELLW